MKHIRAGFKWIWQHKLKSGGIAVLVLTVAYTMTYIVVATATSPTNQTLTLASGQQVAYMQHGEAPEAARRLLLVHGSPADASSWNTFVRKGKDELVGMEVIAVDRLGFGNSSPTTAGIDPTLAEQARALEPLLTDGVILVGHSYGGPVVLRAAADYPGKVGAIVLVAGACDPYMNDSITTRKAINAVSFVVPEPWEVSNRELLALTEENNAMIELIDQVTCPVVIVHGTWDPVCPHDGTVEYLQTSLTEAADVRVVSLERVGHNIHLSEPTRLAEEIRLLAGRLD